MNVPPQMDVWVLAGQSNMEGYGLLNYPALAVASSSDPRVWSFTSAGNWEIAEEPLHRVWESFTPVHQDMLRPGLSETDRLLSNEELARRERENGVYGAGLGISFATAMADATGNNIGLIPAAHGGTTLEQWDFKRKSEGGKSLYGSMLQRIREAREDADFELKGVLWYQGESDCHPGNSATYGERLAAWIEALRADLAMPNLPVYIIQLGRVIQFSSPGGFGDRTSWDEIRDAQRAIPERVRNTGTVSAIDLGLSDSVHIDTPGLIRLGKRLARLALSSSDGPRVTKIEMGETTPNGFVTLRVVCEGVTGGWVPRTRIVGFEIRHAPGVEPRDLTVIEANADARDPKVINLLLCGGYQAYENMELGYGLGHNPPCTLVDEADMPMPAFLPRAVMQQKPAQ